ncbi:AI-2E family transporter [Candidatus Woesearchaeota archaeon]|nr:AI-2E family transporter [Candidatus Woesearchaeota archaeon]
MAIHNHYREIVPFIIFTLALVLLFMLIRPVITILLSSVLLAYISFPLHKRINTKIPNKSISIVLSLIIIIIIILIPFSFLAFEITQQGYYFYNSLSSRIAKGAIFGFGCTSADSEVCLLLNQAERFSIEQLSVFGFDRQLQKFLPILEEKITSLIPSIPLIIAEIFLILVISYFIMKEWKDILKKIVDLLPMRTKTVTRLIGEFGNITHTVVYAQLFVAFVQGIVGTIGFYMAGVPFPIFFGVLLAFCALIPTIGTAIIWAPASLFLILSGYFTHDYWTMGKGIGLFFYGLLIVSTIDNILLAKIVHAKAKVSQIIVIIGVIGGASMFGVVGIFIGPILLPLLITYFETFKERYM